MGIKQLNKLLKSKCKDCINIINLNNFSGKIIAVDISIYLYKYISTNKSNFTDMFILQILKLYKNNILPFYIFDGKPPDAKNDIIQNRKNNKKNIEQKIKDLENDPSNSDAIKKLKSKCIYVTRNHINKCKELFNLFGVPYIEANGEAEALCSKLCKDGYIYGVLSEDFDVLPFGSKYFIKSFNFKTNNVIVYDLKLILEKLKLSYSSFVDMCILCGCDYCPSIYGLGPVNSYKHILKYKNIETFFENNKKYKIPENFNYIKARTLFNTHYTQNDLNEINNKILIKKPNIEKILIFLKNNNTKLNSKYIKLINKKLIINYNNIFKLHNNTNKKQLEITSFFK